MINKRNPRDMSPEGQKAYYRKNASGFSIGIAILTLISSPLMPLIEGVKYSDLLAPILISCALGLAFLVVGILFLKKDSSAVATIMIVLFVLYVLEKIFEIVTTQNFMLGIWLALGILQLVYLFRYQRIKKNELADYLAQPETPAPQV